MKYKYSCVLTAFCFLSLSSGLFAQKKEKLNEKFNVNKEVVVNLNTTHTNIVFETWNKNTVAIEAFVDGEDLSEEEIQYLMDTWKIDAMGNSNVVTIKSATDANWNGNLITTRSQANSQQIQMIQPMLENMLEPIMRSIANNPMPNALEKTLQNVTVDYSGYSNKEKEYLQQWEAQLKKNFEKEYKDNWVHKSLQNGEQPSGTIELRIEAVGDPSNLNIEQFARQMQIWSAQFAKQFGSNFTNTNVYQFKSTPKRNSKINKTIKVRMPKDAKLRLNVRHGELNLAERSNNLNASLSHVKFAANIIDGDQTVIKASYSPMFVSQWNNGRLIVNYVKNCRIETAKNINVNADSSNIYIQQLDENGAIYGSFGAITVENLGNTFATLDLVLENSDFSLNVPKSSPFNFTYTGAQSLVRLPKAMEINARRNFGNQFINGFYKTRDTEKAISINAKYSDIILK